MTTRWTPALLLSLACAGTAAAGGVPLVDASGGSHGSVNASLAKGSVKMKVTGLPRLPRRAAARRGVRRLRLQGAYLVSSGDPAVGVYLADVFPSSSGAAKVKVTKGDLGARSGSIAWSSPHTRRTRGSFDVLTAALP
jgi:hypothetical protein